MTPPAPDVYWTTAALYEGTGGGRTLQQLYTLTEQVAFGGPYYSGNLFFDTPAAYYVADGGTPRARLRRRDLVLRLLLHLPHPHHLHRRHTPADRRLHLLPRLPEGRPERPLLRHLLRQPHLVALELP